MKNKKRKFRNIINHFGIKKIVPKTSAKMIVTLLEGNSYVIKKLKYQKNQAMELQYFSMWVIKTQPGQ